MDILSFIEANMIVVVVALWVLGVFLKDSRIKDALIPWILVIVGLAISLWMNGINPNSVIQGILAAGGAVLTNNLIQQTKELTSKKDVR